MSNTSAKRSTQQLLLVLCQTIGLNTFIYMPQKAVSEGAMGHVICFLFTYILIGIPFLYMEHVIGQFTKRNCLEVWKVRRLFSHFGYIYVIWQLVYIMYCHSINSFIMHYFLVSFENPIPFYTCGYWSSKNCDIISKNYTIHRNCLKNQGYLEDYCNGITLTFPARQYWQYYIMADGSYKVAWRLCVASGVLCLILFLCCLNNLYQMYWTLHFIAIFPTCGAVLFAIGSMMQKGVMTKFHEAVDLNFSVFIRKFDFSAMVAEVVFTLNIGTGISFDVASKGTFRDPVYSNAVVAIMVSCGAILLMIFNVVLGICPYAFEYNVPTISIMEKAMTNTFERFPILINQYWYKHFWLVLWFSFTLVPATGINIIYISGILQLLEKRYPTVRQYRRFFTLLFIVTLFLVTIPFMGTPNIANLIGVKHSFKLIVLFIITIETVVFVFSYGYEKLSEDVYFMQGTPPPSIVKVGWTLSNLVLVYVFFAEFYKQMYENVATLGQTIGWWMLVVAMLCAVLTSLIRVLIALFKKDLHELIRLDPTWGPEDEVLRRSRGMFSSNAMTKEYMYRQHHLQAGIIARQSRSNIRRTYAPQEACGI